MLSELSVQNLSLIEDLQIELRDGYCAWTGETGAGKSLLLSALHLVLGGKASAEMVRAGKPEARAAALFDLSGHPSLQSEVETILGGPLDTDQLILTRRIAATGRSTARANGLPVPLSTLRTLGPKLIDVHGQHETRSLLDSDRQRTLLDAFGNLQTQVSAYQQARLRHHELRSRRLKLIEAAEQRHRERELLIFERDELAAAEPEPGEFHALIQESRRLAQAEAISAAAAEGVDLLYDHEESVQAILGRLARRLESLTEAAPELVESVATLDRLAEESREVSYSLRDLTAETSENPGRLEELEARLALYRQLERRFRCPPDQLADRLVAIEDQLAAIERDETDLAQLDQPLRAAWEHLKETAVALTQVRQRCAKSFTKAVRKHLTPLNLRDAKLVVEIETVALGDDPTATSPPELGADRLEILFAANPGEPARSLRKVASGGELSRLTLAIKTVLAGVDGVPTLVFDEIDTGVGGRLGAVLGRTIASLAEHHQVICITHLPQMASFARHQWVIRKETVRGCSRTTIEELVDTDRVSELAAMLRGDSAAESTKQEASAMLAEAQAAGAH